MKAQNKSVYLFGNIINVYTLTFVLSFLKNISILKWFLKDHVTLKIGVVTVGNSAFNLNKIFYIITVFAVFWHLKTNPNLLSSSVYSCHLHVDVNNVQQRSLWYQVSMWCAVWPKAGTSGASPAIASKLVQCYTEVCFGLIKQLIGVNSKSRGVSVEMFPANVSHYRLMTHTWTWRRTWII